MSSEFQILFAEDDFYIYKNVSIPGLKQSHVRKGDCIVFLGALNLSYVALLHEGTVHVDLASFANNVLHMLTFQM